jgi:hypothetical protein
MKARGAQFSFDMPLFVQDKSKSAMLPENIQGMMQKSQYAPGS